MEEKGLTIPEVLVTIGILAFMFVMGVPAMQNFLQRNQIHLSAREVTHALRRAQIRSAFSEARSNLGVRFTSGTGTGYTVFRGSSFEARDTEFDEDYTLPGTVGISFDFASVTSTLDVLFSRGRGKPLATGTIYLSEVGNPTLQITVGDAGVIQTE